ncbi:sigma-54-dependent Fis family transcriptional regulator [Fusibacter sp. 3D3]|uniref:sigma-54 interaction domain-containing protein n=1 Tax=Fusibacter sp. 3D3 TaxID=1048380 RepID=UPI000852DDA1|nr:sigma 54-interacting transcriptional regulator [Fusibacter sp. 3D3]GAU78515.1 response regulator of zinc sigma-54-dependent two-component system [Fusibacter sp. 3D3]
MKNIAHHDCFYKRILETSHDEIWVSDHEGKTIYCNKAFERNYGMKREEIMGKTAMYLVENGYSDQTPITEVLKSKKPCTLPQKTVTGINLMITATPVVNRQGDIEFVVANTRDITELEQLKRDMTTQTDQLDRYKQEIDVIRKQNVFQPSLHQFKSHTMTRLYETIERIAATMATVMIQGESGTGKTEIAKLIHQRSHRVEGPFITINCSAIPNELFESEFFGYESGAFTGAKAKGKKGLVELADKGTLFLDEIGEIPILMQSKLLQFIQEQSFTKVGGDKLCSVDTRIIVATNRNLLERVHEKLFREDLYYRLSVVSVELPPLRERREDIDSLVQYFLNKYASDYSVEKKMTANALKHLKHHTWQGNIRELQNLIHNLVLMTTGTVIQVSDLPPSMLVDIAPKMDDIDLDHIVSLYEGAIVKACYDASKSSYKLAKALNISQSRAIRLIKKYVKPTIED